MSDLIPLTPLQEGMLYESTASGRPWVNLEQIVVHLDREPVEADAMGAAWQGMVDANPVLRMVIEADAEDRPMQRVHGLAEVPLTEHDWSADPAPEARLEDWLAEDRLRGVDPGLFPGFRVTLAHLGPKRGILVWTFPHTLLDGRSVVRLLEELFQRYELVLAGKAQRRPRPGGANDVFVAHCVALEKMTHADGIGYFAAYLQGYDGASTLVDPKAEPGRKQLADHFLNREETEALEAFARTAGVTVATVAMVAWGIVLGRVSHRGDAVFGMTVAGRHLVEGAADAVGCFLNTVPVRVQLRHGQSLGALLEEVRAHQLALRPFEQTPLAAIHRGSDVPGTRPLFDTMVMFDRGFVPREMARQGGGWDGRTVAFHEEGGAAATLAVYHEPELMVRLEYDPAQVPDGPRLAEYALRLLKAMPAAGPEAALSSLDMLGEAEAERLRSLAVPEPAVEPGERDCLDLFEAVVAATPEAVAVSQPGAGALSYGALDARATAVAQGLRARGVSDGSKVVLVLPRGADHVVALLACWKAGAAFVPVDPSYPQAVQAAMCEDSGAGLAVCLDAVPDLPCPVLPIAELAALGQAAKPAPLANRDASRPAYVVFTSGSTGRPKGVVVSQAGLAAHAAAVGPLYGLEPQDRVLQFASLSFDVSLEEIVPTLLTGAELVLRDEAMLASFSGFLETAAAQAVTVLNLPTAFWSALTDEMEAAGLRLPPSVRLVIVGGERVPAPVLARWRALTPQVRWINGYGPTEATITCTVWEAPAGGEVGESVPIGRPLGHARALVLSADGARAPLGAVGELWIAGPAVAKGYIGRDDLTAERFLPAPDWIGSGRMYRTGDLVRWRETGVLDYLGRADRQIKLRGFRLEPEGLEQQIEAVSGVDHAVVAVDDEAGGEDEAGARLIAWVSLAAGADVATVEARVRDSLPAFARPLVVPVTDWPKTPGGKIDLRRLPRPAQVADEPEMADDTPVDAETQAVMAAFRKVLKRRKVGPDQSFFDLGGHSILVLRLIARLEGQVAAKPAVAMVHANPTPRALAAAIRADAGMPLDPQVVVPIQTEGTRPPLYGIHVIGENGSFFRPLAEELGPDQPFFGLSVGMLSDQTPTGIEDTARFYCEQIEKHYPEGPLALAAVSLGSYVAFELAQRLRAGGRDVCLLALFDAEGPAGRPGKTGSAKLAVHAWRLRREGPGYAARWTRQKLDNLRHRTELLRRRWRDARREDEAPALSIGQFVAANDLARRAYDPKPYGGRIAVFRAMENHFDNAEARRSALGWRPVAAGGLDLTDVPGDHLTMLEQPNAAVLALALKTALAGCR